jgi:hypothetical protein
MNYRKNQLKLVEESDEDDDEESDEESEEEQLPPTKTTKKPRARARTKPTAKGRGQSRLIVGGKAPKAAVTMDMTVESSDEEAKAPPTKKFKKVKAKGRQVKRTLSISESPSKVKLGSAVVANSSFSQQQQTLSVAAMLRKKIAEFQVTTRPLFTYLLSESTAHRSLPVFNVG